MTATRLVVVGNGMAATRLVEELVARGAVSNPSTGSGSGGSEGWTITVLGDEPHPPYNRILLSAVLEGTHRPEALTLRGEEWYAEHGIDLRLGARVLEIERDLKDVMLVDGTIIEYDVLVLATGSIPTLPPIRGLVRMDGSLHESVHAFRSLDDCDRLLAALKAGPRRAVVVGGGLLGLQVARALGARGIDTEVVEGGDHLLHQQLGAAAGRMLARDLKRLGVAVYTGARAVRMADTDDGAVALRLDTGFTLDTDLVVLTAGGRPSTALARRAGLEVRRGIVVDDRLASVTDPDIHALGDCVEHSGRVTGFVPPAWEQAGVLAGVLTEEPVKYDGSRTVARLRATGLDVAVLGDPEREVANGGEVVEMSNPVRGSHRKLVVRDGRIVAGALVGDLNRIGLITQHYDRQTVLGPTEPGDLLLVERSSQPLQLPDDAEVCNCAGVTVAAVRACSSFEDARTQTRATTGCGGCASTVRQILAGRSSFTPEGIH
ncbi:FAD-dependent oxidoreductase [Nocardioides bizhenqiangii]|uniref:FAD-dependent oxidoreductase n=1 Tax=Nocardioides bizhenqiangii TaxID=3095076 RepID=A0ABZ0ZR49_9ACTN|nr:MULTISPECIES: FAD-dependent oxidoreductase [unclassified Nocardioides]MDZ5622545.1 FAD-dependent oxidoreductase [Nocardioides sp. HM23]WQQ26800.1 FAD-dependent oxidoreductase [Nocardioides sp. HM61]